MRKSTNNSFMGTYSSINIRYVPTNIYKQNSSIIPSKFDIDETDISNIVHPVEELLANNQQEDPTQTGFVE